MDLDLEFACLGAAYVEGGWVNILGVGWGGWDRVRVALAAQRGVAKPKGIEWSVVGEGTEAGRTLPPSKFACV